MTAAGFQTISVERTTKLNLLLSCPVPRSENVKRASCIGDSSTEGLAVAVTSKTGAQRSRERHATGHVEGLSTCRLSQLFYPSCISNCSSCVFTDRTRSTDHRSLDATIFESRIETLSKKGIDVRGGWWKWIEERKLVFYGLRGFVEDLLYN